MHKNLVKIAAELDTAGFKMEADIVDVIIRRVASELGEQEDNSEEGDTRGVSTTDMSEEDFASLVANLEGLNEEDEGGLDEGGLDEESYEEWDAREREAGRR